MSDNPFGSNIFYKDPRAALAWLERAFGFKTTMLIDGPDGDDSQMHAEMKFGSGMISVGGEWAETIRSPQSVGGANTQSLEVHLDEDVDAHCARARGAGAAIVREPKDEPWGDRRYRALDLEGHLWSFAQHIEDVSHEELQQRIGRAIQNPAG
jgi:uncharacterized glyoxalase superfamily protein PhnB